jgi:hypothetical protein
MKNLVLMPFLLSLLFLANEASAQQIQLNVDNPIIKTFIKKALQEYIPKVTKNKEKVQDIQFETTKKTEDYTALKGTVLFANQKAALGNGNYRFKLKIGNNLLKPKIYSLKLQVARIWFIRFYKKVIG